MRIRSVPGTFLLAAGIVATSLLAPVPALAKIGLQFDLQLGGPCLAGYKPTADPIKVKLLRSDGHALETAHDNSTNVTWGVCFDRVPVAGNKIQLINGSDQDRTVTVPRLTLEVDRVTSVIKGRGPAGKTLLVSYRECYPAGCDAPVEMSTPVNGNGRYHRDLSASAIDIDGSDQINAQYQTIHGDRFTRITYAPYMEIIKPNKIFAGCLAQGSTTLRLRTSGGTLRATRTFHASTDCSGFFGSFKKNGHAVNVHTGDRISSDLATDASLVWPAMSVNGSGTTVSGRCIASSRYVVFFRNSSSSTSTSGTTDGTGHFSTTVLWSFDPGDRLDLICETSRGDHVRIQRTI
jgi:hypothetical protein